MERSGDLPWAPNPLLSVLKYFPEVLDTPLGSW
jgi:hypothetical protein